MSDKPILYAKAGGPPDNWQNLRVLRNGAEDGIYTEVDVMGCWGIRYARDSEGKQMYLPDGSAPALEKVYGNFVIEVLPDPAPPVRVSAKQAVDGPSPSVAGANPHPAHDHYFYGAMPPITSDDDPGDADPQVYWKSPTTGTVYGVSRGNEQED